ncbi:MAG: signal recognition particle-docking protein FtsY [Candidatus Thermoplasmatota archaeon]|jgi:fused signal recognition particle receptor|nr:signal recognition particle-docking protein FtsY [Candidatus Thermoplasmatota archaeon]
MFEKLKEKLGLSKKDETPTVTRDDGGIADSIGTSSKDLNEIAANLKISLIEADVALPVADRISNILLKKLDDKSVRLKGDRNAVFKEAVRTTLKEIAAVTPIDLVEMASKKSPFVVMFVGMNGTGKTTSIAKIAENFKEKGYYVVIAASDTFRAGAIEQIALHGEKIGVKVIKHQAGGDPAAVSFDAVKHASKIEKSVVLIDTAGRMQNNKNLLEEMKKIKRISSPDLILLTLDALSGTDVLTQAKLFDEAVGINGYIVTKIDADAKGGCVISLLSETKKPILYIGTGQTYSDLVQFSLDWYLNRLLN